MVCIRPHASEAPRGVGVRPQELNRTRGTPCARPKLARRRVPFDGHPAVSVLSIELLELVDSRERVLLKCIAQLADPSDLDRVEQHAAHHLWRRRIGLSVHRGGEPLTGKVGDERGAGRGRDDGIEVAQYLFIPFLEGRLGVEQHISHNYTMRTRQSTGCQVPVRIKKRHEPLGDLVPFIF